MYDFQFEPCQLPDDTKALRAEVREFLKENLEGFVVLKFDITETGSTDNIKIVKSSPKGIFEKNAIAAFKQWQYKPAIKNGKAMKQKGLLVQLDFKLAP